MIEPRRAAAPLTVAVDGSPESEAALHWAVIQAQASSLALRVVTAFDPPDTGSDAAGAYPARFEAAEATARDRVAALISELTDPSSVDHVVLAGPIERTLVALSAESSLVVVGTRSTDGWLTRLRRSVTNRITGQMACPVVSVPLDALAGSAVATA